MDLDSIFKEDSVGVKLSFDKPLTIRVGDASITLTPSGDIVLKGARVTAESTNIKITGKTMTEISAQGLLTIKGSLLKLN